MRLFLSILCFVAFLIVVFLANEKDIANCSKSGGSWEGPKKCFQKVQY